MYLVRSSLVVLATLVLGACGSDDEKPAAQPAPQAQVQACSAKFVSEHNDVVLEVQSLDRKAKSTVYSKEEIREQAETCIAAAQKFKRNHGGVVCRAEKKYQDVEVNATEWADNVITAVEEKVLAKLES